MSKQSGIYKITNILNNHCYVGSAVNINRRFITHRYRLNDQTHHSSYFQNAWNKYGSEAFIYEILLYCSKSDLIFYEQRAIDTYKPEYNMCPTAGSSLGRKLTEEHKAKISASGKGRIVSEETRKNLSEAKKGKRMCQEAIDKMAATKRGAKIKPRTPEACANLSKALMGHVHSQETKDKIAEKARQRTGERNSMFGKTHSDETREKISIAAKNRKMSDETKEKISLAQKQRLKKD